MYVLPNKGFGELEDRNISSKSSESTREGAGAGAGAGTSRAVGELGWVHVLAQAGWVSSWQVSLSSLAFRQLFITAPNTKQLTNGDIPHQQLKAGFALGGLSLAFRHN